jgi:hypothetical protein
MKARAIKARNNDEQINKTVVGLREVTRPTIKAQTLAEKLANDAFHYRNWYYKGGREKFPMAPQMQYVDKYFPYAEGGPLAVDEATYLDDPNTLKLKKDILKESGVRYVCIVPGMTDLDAMEQIA